MGEFVNSEAGQRAMAEAQPVAPLALAQNLAYDAWEAEGSERYRLARQALSVDERCSDAWLILAEEERTWRKQRRLFEKAVAAAERACADEGWLDDPDGGSEGRLGGVGSRSYLRAHMALARCLMDGGYHSESAAHYETMLRRDPDDHLGARCEVIQLYHFLDNLAALRALLAQYDGDDFCILAYERLWLALVDHNTEDVDRLASVATDSNPHVMAYLTGQSQIPDRLPDSIVVGGEDEAASYAGMSVRWWLDNPRTVAWLRAQAAK
ncbi:MAG: hypothetical protein ACM3XN_08335 [Chloroflexota bacterium]